MKFEDAINKVANITDLRRVARAHVVDHRQLSNDQLAAATIKSKAQYIDRGTLHSTVVTILHREPREDLRALAHVFLVDVLLEQYDTQLTFAESDERVIAFEQHIVNMSNETDLVALACGDKSAKRYRDLELYRFVLGVAWENQDSVSPDEANLLHKLRERLRINETEHRVLDAHLGKRASHDHLGQVDRDGLHHHGRGQRIGRQLERASDRSVANGSEPQRDRAAKRGAHCERPVSTAAHHR